MTLRSVLFAAFTLSGFSGLIYESIWTHYLKLFLGHSAYAQSLVLAIFMGGMAIGAALAARRSHRWGNALRAYALCEGLVGLLAVGFHPAFTAFLDLAYDSVIPGLGSADAVLAFKWTASAALILPQSILLGLTFPLMSAGVLRRFPDAPGASLSMLYFTNSIGGAAGVLMSGFVLIDRIGLPGTIVTAGVINLLLASWVWSIAGPAARSPADSPRSTDATQRANYLTNFMRHPEFAPVYLREMKHLCDTVLSPEQVNPLFDQLLSGWVSDTNIISMKNYVAARRAYVLSVLPLTCGRDPVILRFSGKSRLCWTGMASGTSRTFSQD